MKDAMISALAEKTGDSENLRKVKALYRALKSGNKQALRGFPGGGVYCGLSEIFDGFYQKLRGRVVSFGAFPDSFVEDGDTIVTLGHYHVTKNETVSPISIRFCHVWRMDDKGRVKGIWQVADSARFFAP